MPKKYSRFIHNLSKNCLALNQAVTVFASRISSSLEIGETPINSIRREIQEEAGFSANKWDELGTLVPAPGYADEEIYLFLARDLDKLNSEVKGDLDEDIEVLILDPDELDNLISSGDEILDAKTVTAWFRAKQFLDKL